VVETPKNVDTKLHADCYVEEAFPVLKAGMSEVVLSNGSFSCMDLIEYLLDFTGPAYVDCATWCAGSASLRSIENFLESEILKFRLIIDGGAANVMRKDGFQNQVVSRFGEDSIVRCLNHAKFFLVYNRAWRFVVLTSANFNRNNRMEFFNVFEDAEMCGKMIGIVNQLFEDQSAVLNKKVFK
jgi:hypothetical protein